METTRQDPPTPDRQRMTRRIVVVRAGATALYRALARRFADDPATLVIVDRRRGRRDASIPRQRTDRRFPQDTEVLLGRGFYVVRVRPEPRPR